MCCALGAHHLTGSRSSCRALQSSSVRIHQQRSPSTLKAALRGRGAQCALPAVLLLHSRECDMTTTVSRVFCLHVNAFLQAYTPMQRRGGAALTFLLVLSLLIETVRACGGHDHSEVAPWDRGIDVKGRRRSLLSMRSRRCANRELARSAADGLKCCLSTLRWWLLATALEKCIRAYSIEQHIVMKTLVCMATAAVLIQPCHHATEAIWRQHSAAYGSHLLQ